MVDKDLLDDTARTIEQLLAVAQHGNTPSVSMVVEASKLADTLREVGEEIQQYDLPEPGDKAFDTGRHNAPMEVSEVYEDFRADEFDLPGGVTVADDNQNHPNDAPVVAAQYGGSGKIYHFPVTRLDW